MLHELPFASLRNPRTGRYLAEDFELSVVPSATVLSVLRNRPPGTGRRALILGDPEEGVESLEGALRSARKAADLLGAEPLLGRQASESAVWEKAPGAAWVHFGTHGTWDPVDPEGSYLLLAPGSGRDGRLEVREIVESLDLQGTKLVTLAACETARGERTGGDEVLGLTRAFLAAGSSAVLSSLWPVDDEGTARLMGGLLLEPSRRKNRRPGAAGGPESADGGGTVLRSLLLGRLCLARRCPHEVGERSEGEASSGASVRLQGGLLPAVFLWAASAAGALGIRGPGRTLDPYRYGP